MSKIKPRGASQSKQTPAAIVERINQGLAFHRKGNFAEAEQTYREIVAGDANNIVALHLLGVLMVQTRRLENGVEFIDRALAIKPDYVEALNDRGYALMELRRLDEALASFDEALAIKPDYAEAHNNRGNALQSLKRLKEALASFDNALMVKPGYAEALYNRGNALQALKRPDEALASYDRALAVRRGYAEALNNRGKALQELRRLNEALSSYDGALAVRPAYAEALNNRGKALQELKRTQEALASYDQALAVKPDYAEALNNRGNALQDLERFEEALACYEKALIARPDYAEALNNRGNALQGLERFAEALASYDEALAIKPDYARALNNRGNALRALHRPAEALASYDRALAVKFDYAEALHGRGLALTKLERPDETLASFDRALAINPDYAEALNNRGVALQQLDRPYEALASYDEALALDPDFAEAFNNRGSALLALRRPDDALACFDRALAAKPGYAEALLNRGVALTELGRLDEALASYDKMLAIKPDDSDALYNRGLAALLTGDFAAGWAGYERRWNRKEVVGRMLTAPFPVWRGENISGRKIVVYEEQGHGDVIQFSRYLLRLAEMGAQVTFLARPGLERLMLSLGPSVRVLTALPAGEDFDVQAALMSLPLAFETRLDKVPAETPYLRAEPERVQKWKSRLGGHGFKVGIAWQGSKLGNIDMGRSIPLAAFLGLSRIPNVRLISLQKNLGVEQLRSLPEGMQVETLGDDFDAAEDSFLDAAAVMDSLDLVVSSDTAIAHLAGALARPVWVALKYVPDWRWLLKRADSPWYPTMRLFRQQTSDDWRGVFARIEASLSKLVGAKGKSDASPSPLSSCAPEQAPALAMDAFVISMPRTPERLELFRRMNGGIADFRLFEGIDGARADRRALVQSGLLEDGTSIHPGVLGNALSHIALWRQVAETGKAALICEDDVRLGASFPRDMQRIIDGLRPDWDIILWSWNFDSIISAEMAPQLGSFVAFFDQSAMRANIDDYLRAEHNPAPLRLKHAFGTCCYCVSPAGATKILEFIRPIRKTKFFVPGLNRRVETAALDGMLNCLYNNINAFVSWPPIALTPNDRGASTVASDVDLQGPTA